MSETTYALTARRLPSFQVGAGYVYQFATVNGVGTSTYAIIAGAAPSGATLSATGLFSYAGRAVGKYTFTVRAIDDSAQSTTVVATFEVYGSSFGTLNLNTVPSTIVEAADRVLAARATLPAWLRHFAKLPDPESVDFAHFASDVGIDPAEGSAYQSLAAVFSALWNLTVAAPTRLDIDDKDGDDVGTPYRTYRIGQLGEACYLGLGDAASLLTRFTFAVSGTDSEWVNADGFRLKVVELKTVDGETVTPGSNHIDSRGFWTNRNLAGAPVSVDGLVLKVEIDVTGPGTDAFPVDDSPQILCGVASPLSALAPDALLAAVKFATSAEARAAQGGAASVVEIDGDPVPVSGAIAFVGTNGLDFSYDSGSGEVTATLSAEINGVAFAAGALTLEAGPFVALTADVGAHKIVVAVDPGVATINSRPAVGYNFVIQSATPGQLAVSAADGLITLTPTTPDATPTTRGLMTATQAEALGYLTGGGVVDLHRHTGDTVRMGSSVNSANGLLAFDANTPIATLLSQINDYLATQYADPGVGSLTGQALLATGGDGFGTATISADLQQPVVGLVYSSPNYVAGVSAARCKAIIGAPTLEYVVAAFSGANQGDVVLYLNGVEIDAVTLSGANGTFNGANGKLSVVVTTIPGTLSSRQGEATVTIEAADLGLGYNVVRLSHEYAIGDVRDAADYVFFADDNDTGWTGGALSLGASGTPFYLSGVPYYAAAEHVLLSLAAITDFALTTVLAAPLRWRFNAGAWSTITRTDPALTGLSSPPDVRDTPSLLAYNTGVDVGSLASGFSASVEGLSLAASPPLTKLATENTHFRLLRVASAVSAETATLETFIGETYRTLHTTWTDYAVRPTAGVPSGQIRAYGWNSGLKLTAPGAAPWGEAGSFAPAQVAAGSLVWPTLNYTTISGLIPALASWLGGSADSYAAYAAAAAVWFDRFVSVASAQTTLRIRVWCDSHDLRTEAGASYRHSAGADHKKFNLEMRLPTLSPWLDCVMPAVGNYGTTGAGVRRSAITTGSDAVGTYYDFLVVTGAATAYQGVVLRVTLRNTAVVIKQIQVTNGTGGAL